uniref:C-type lectin domain-containing protein n=1 Tax=Lates calcarifer TaxID=8187 RepID=A0A4W6EYP7_LATCA
MALTTAAVVPEAEPVDKTEPSVQEVVPEAEPVDKTEPSVQEVVPEAEPVDKTEPSVQEVVPEAEPVDKTEPSVQEEESESMEPYSFCPSGWTGFDGRCFLYVPTAMTWANAEKHCQGYGGNLASVHSFVEHHEIQGMILRATQGFPATWLGGCDAAQEGTWFWSDGTPFWFSFWSPGQPDNFMGGQHCLLTNFGAEKNFDDGSCSGTLPFVCARKL